jgi:hypothetical protein
LKTNTGFYCGTSLRPRCHWFNRSDER